MCRSALALALLVTTYGCDQTCTRSAQCVRTGDICAPGLNLCRKECDAPIDCTDGLTCSPLSNGSYACLKSNEITQSPPNNFVDDSLGNQCATETSDFAACGDNAPLCTPVFKGDASLGDVNTCTTECAVDNDCTQRAPLMCTGDCLAQYENMACFPSLPLSAPEMYFGNKRDAAGQTIPLFCRPRLFSYLVPKRCTSDAECGKAGSRAGDKCTRTADTGGACLSGQLGLYECCQREGECVQAPNNDPTKGLSCTPSADNLAGFCSKPCTSDADCTSASALDASCWTTTYAETNVTGKCRVVENEHPICRPTAKPAATTGIVDCKTDDRPANRPDNRYDSGLRRCVRTL